MQHTPHTDPRRPDPPAPALVATDLDGTLVGSDGRVSPRTRAALGRAEAAGAVVVLVTGRPPRWMARIAEETGHHGVAICANGALRYDLRTARIVGHSAFPAGAAAGVVSALRAALPDLAFAAERVRGFAAERTYRQEVPGDDHEAADRIEELLVDHDTVKLLARLGAGGDADELLATARTAVGDLATLTHSNGDALLEISASGVTKASALEELAAEHGVGPEGVIALGDMPNDLPMLSWAGHGVAMANAHPAVLAVADQVTAANDDDGVARVLERLFPGGAPG